MLSQAHKSSIGSLKRGVGGAFDGGGLWFACPGLTPPNSTPLPYTNIPPNLDQHPFDERRKKTKTEIWIQFVLTLYDRGQRSPGGNAVLSAHLMSQSVGHLVHSLGNLYVETKKYHQSFCHTFSLLYFPSNEVLGRRAEVHVLVHPLLQCSANEWRWPAYP